ncbi:MAG: sugar-binding domain-containing protein [Acidobacteriaceae bacterium]
MPDTCLTRRKFLQVAGATGLSTGIASALPRPSADKFLPNQPAASSLFVENGLPIPDEGWHLWMDEKATWQEDAIYLPEEVQLEKLPIHPPSGGWDALKQAASLPVTLPSTVEQYYWGKFGQRPYTAEEYRYADDDPIPQNGAYRGVSWWWRELAIPADFAGKRILLHVRGARMRAEVYLNQKLVGYSILEELPFECDLTDAAHPGGRNQLAIRITNPGGRYDWVDGLTISWGAVKLYRSHGFAGLDRGMTLSAHAGSVRLADSWVLNLPDPTKVLVRAELEHLGTAPVSGSVLFEILEPATGKALQQVRIPVSSISNQKMELDGGLGLAHAELWSLEHPRLYQMRATWHGDDGLTDSRTVTFGFRWFGPDGLGKDAVFRLNGRRIKLYSSISWGFWGLNGLWPTPELAEKEVMQAKKLGLNCLNFHRNVGKEDVLRAQDRLGLLRYMEPGGGKLAIGMPAKNQSLSSPDVKLDSPQNAAARFSQRFMIAKCVTMVKTFRSHPSLIQYTLQNEIGADLKNPDVEAILTAMHREDPSRSVVLNDGFVARGAAQAWYEPYNDKMHRSDEEEYGGWWNNHQGAGDQWYDAFYQSPTHFTYREARSAQLVEFGEMEGCAVPDNHSLMLHQIAQRGGTSYDLEDHKQIVAGYEKFLTRWGFRKAYPTAEHVFLAVGRKSYESWKQYMENARICNDVDFAVISGWESTAIENHSGIVDNLRNFKSDPKLIHASLLPVRPVAKQRHLAVAMGESAVFDLYLLNDTSRPVSGELKFTMIDPKGKVTELGAFPAPVFEKDQFSVLVKEALTSPALMQEGPYRFKFALSSEPLSTHTREIWVVNTKPGLKKPLRVGIAGVTSFLHSLLQNLPGMTIENFSGDGKYDVIVTSGMHGHLLDGGQVGDETGLEAAPKKGEHPKPAAPGEVPSEVLTAFRQGTPLLVFAPVDSLADGVARQLADMGAFTYNGQVGDYRAPWMGNWYFLREHPVYSGLPMNQAMDLFYQAKGRPANGLLVDGTGVDVFVGYSRDHDRRVGAGTFTAKLGNSKLLFQRVPEMNPIFQQRWLANALDWLTQAG